MYKFNSTNIVILFAPGSRGNFLRCCLTLSPNTADAAFKMSSIQHRLNTYIANTVIPVSSKSPPWGPGHMDKYLNFDFCRFRAADSADRYIHCAHLLEIPKVKSGSDHVECVPLAHKKFVVITITDQDCQTIQARLPNEINDEFHFFSNQDKINQFFADKKWNALPYNLIQSKTKLLDFVVHIDPYCYIDQIEHYYDAYKKNCM